MAINFGLTGNGFVSPTYEEWLDDIEDDMRSRFGDDIVLTSNSNFGILAREIAWRQTEMAQQLEFVYYSGFYSSATDSALDRLGSNVGIARKVATPSHASITVTTDGEYLIQADTRFETDDGIFFNLTDDLITKKDAKGTWTGTGNVESFDTGAMNNVLANTITIVSDPDDTILSVTNPNQAVGGQDDESDSDYRKRLIMENAAKPGPTENGIKAALFNVQGVRQVGIVPNGDSTADKYGNPPYSIHIYVLGGSAKDIAQALYDNVAAGVTLVGSQAVSITDSLNTVRIIKFDYATSKSVFVQVHIKTDNSFNSDSGVKDIQDNISNSINQLKMGDTVLLTKLYPVVYSENGVNEAQITMGISASSFNSNDITSKQFEVPVCDSNNVKVIIDD